MVIKFDLPNPIIWTPVCFILLGLATVYARQADPCAGKEESMYISPDYPSPSETGFGYSVRTRHEECIADHLKVFAGYEWAECNLVVYLSDRNGEQEATKLLTPYIEQNSFCESSGDIVFEDALYTYRELEKLELQAMNLLAQVPQINTFGRWDGKISIFVEYDATIEKVRQVLLENNLPLDAFFLNSREQELSAVKSIAPRVNQGEEGLEVFLPAVVFDTQLVGELQLGKSSMKEVEKTMPSWPGHGPSKIPKPQKGKHPEWSNEHVIGVINNLKYSFNPKGSFMIAGFDKDRRLIFAQFAVQQGQEKTLRDKLWELTDFSAVHSEDEFVVYNARIGDCVIVEATESEPWYADSRVVTQVVYFYVCP